MRTLLVDDHALFRDGVASLLLAWGHEVVGQASDGAEAVDLVDETSPEVVLMDVRMPNVSGLEATARIKERHPEVAIVMLTVSEDEADLFRAIKAITPATAAQIIDEFLRTPSGHRQSSQRLTDRETEVLRLVTDGQRNREIATELGISENTVKFHLKNIVEKLHAQNRAELAARAVREGLVPDPPSDRAWHERSSRHEMPLRPR
jgi:DNA-binding NarL/FixJ family response regulator